MRNLTSSTIVVLAMITGTANAGEWDGAYIGLQGNYSWSDGDSFYSSETDIGPAPDYDFTFAEGLADLNGSLDDKSSGAMGGLRIGYDANFDENIVVGVVADMSFGNVTGKNDDDFGNFRDGSTEDYVETESSQSGTLRGRLGWATQSTLIYATGGWAWGQFDVTSRDYTGPANTDYTEISDKANLSGLVLGAGVELQLADNYSISAEYLHSDYKQITLFADELWESKSDISTDTVMISLNYRF